MSEDMSEEAWKTFPLDARYEVSILGRVRTRSTGRIRKPVRIKSGYMTILFSTPTGPILRYVHRIVLETWKGACPPGTEASHLDGDRTNNKLSNLTWETPKSNHQRKVQHKTDYNGERNPAHILTWDEVLAVRNEFNELVKKLAAEFKVSRTAMRRVLLEQSWLKKFSP